MSKVNGGGESSSDETDLPRPVINMVPKGWETGVTVDKARTTFVKASKRWAEKDLTPSKKIKPDYSGPPVYDDTTLRALVKYVVPFEDPSPSGL